MRYYATSSRTINLPGRQTFSIVAGQPVPAGRARTLLNLGRHELLTTTRRNATNRREQWTRTELESARDSYRSEGGHLVNATAAFIESNPNSRHTRDSVWQTICQFRTLDLAYPRDTQFKVTLLLAEVAAEFPDEFCSSRDAAIAICDGATIEEVREAEALAG